jgi:hypothetical protein
MLKRFRFLIILAGFCAACDGTPIEAASSALYSFGPNAKNEGFGNVTTANCPGTSGAVYSLGSQMTVVPQSFGAPYAADTYAAYFAADSHATISLGSGAIPLLATMDGSYHVLVNDTLAAGIGTKLAWDTAWLTADGLWYKNPVEIPANGLKIYAAGERSDYPNGVAMITLDGVNNPESSPLPDRAHARCTVPLNFTFGL